MIDMNDRRKGSLFWQILNLAVNFSFLLLSVTIMTLLLRNENYREQMFDFTVSFEEYKEYNKKVQDNHLNYLESRINRISANQDSYQETTNSRIRVLESRITISEKMKQPERTFINNVQTNNNNK